MKGKGVKTAQKSYLVEAVPLTSSGPLGTLSYFSSTKIPAGALVRIPIRNRLTSALVVASKEARSAKSEIRKAFFSLKKIKKSDILEASLAPRMIEAMNDVATHYATTLGIFASAIIPKMALDEPETFFPVEDSRKRRILTAENRETVLLQMEKEDRFGQYRALVRSSFARDASVMFVVPTHFDAAQAKEELSKGISEFVHTIDTWSEALDEKHPVLFITTPSGLLLPRPDIDTLIVERASSRSYRMLTRPYVDLRYFAERLAKRREWRLVLGDSVLSVETLWREKNGEFGSGLFAPGEYSLVRWRLSAAPTKLIDSSTKQDVNGRFEIFSPELKEFIANALAEKSRIFLFGARKGLSPTTVCGDCGVVLPCKNCGAPVVLHKKTGDKETVYVCHACGAVRESLTACGSCGSWRLVPLGIGIEEIAKQASLLFPTSQVLILDKDHASTDTKARAIIKKFNENGGILVGTELAFFHLDRVPYTAAVSLDALFSVPDFHINERIFYLMSRLRELSEKEVLIQTRRGTAGNQILAWAAQGNITDFYQEEIADRESLLYPPFSVFVKIRVADSRHLAGLREALAKWNPDVFRDSVIIRIPRAHWPDEELRKILSLLGPDFSIKVDPESIL